MSGNKSFGSWFQFVIGGLIAGLVAWGGIGARVASLETKMLTADQRASEDRATFNENVRALNGEIRSLSAAITQEHEDRLRTEYIPNIAVPRFGPDSRLHGDRKAP